MRTDYHWFPWNGSKRWLLNELTPIIKKWDGIGKFVDPFLGGGSISMVVKDIFPQTTQLVSDANPWLASAFVAQTDCLKIPENYCDITYWRNLSDSDLATLSDVDRANRFAICLFTAWGNRWETSTDGRFRSTINKKYCDPIYLKARLEKFWSVKWLSSKDSIACCDWKEAVKTVKAGDLVYIDPPYPESLGYGNQWWSFSDQLDIVDWASDSIKQGVNIIVSNMATIERLYSRAGMQTKIVAGPKSSKTKRDRNEVIAWYIK